ncbi:Uncharacterised protein [Clostridioides difficile]|nr:hypothetical protein BER43_000321 [Clostridioides difficile]SJW17063.1 Uncharacterised protein [Clostridioides difficile]SJW65528.1 Uncharacterised protein [Clostridioides difficile]
MCCDSSFLLSYFPIFCGVKIVFCPLFITVSRYYDMYTQGGVTYTPLPNAYGVALRLFQPYPLPYTVGTARNGWTVTTTIFSLTVHAYSCCQSENIFSKCLLKRVIDLIVLNHSICYDNNAIRITCQELSLDFFNDNKYDRLIKRLKGEDIP